MNEFNYEQYLLNYPELKNLTREMAIRHFKRVGQFEKRTDQLNKKEYKITVITPSCRPENLLILKESLNLDLIS